MVEGNFLQPIIQSRTVDLHPAVETVLADSRNTDLWLVAMRCASPRRCRGDTHR